jgi:hypothetical protein
VAKPPRPAYNGRMTRIKTQRGRLLDAAHGQVPTLETALRVLGWELDGPKRTPGGWKATIRRGSVSVLATGSRAEEVLEELLRDAEDRANESEGQP